MYDYEGKDFKLLKEFKSVMFSFVHILSYLLAVTWNIYYFISKGNFIFFFKDSKPLRDCKRK